MTNETKHYRRYTIALVLLTIVEMIAFHFAMSIEGILMLFPLNLAFIILWIYAFVIVFRCFRMRNKWQRCIMTRKSLIESIMDKYRKLNIHEQPTHIVYRLIQIRTKST